MKETRILMGMPVSVEIAEPADAPGDLVGRIFDYFKYIDEKFSTYKETSEITQLNRGRIKKSEASEDMRKALALSEETKLETAGYFDVFRGGFCDPSGLVKGWAIYNAAEILKNKGAKRFYIEAGGDIEARGFWKIGIRNPFKKAEIAKVILAENQGVATSGTYERGRHIYNPLSGGVAAGEIISLTVIGPNIYEADRFATAAFAMGRAGISFIENLKGFEGYMIDENGLATLTSGFEKYAQK